MTKEEKQLWLEAINYLVEYYKGKRKLDWCPFCAVVKQLYKKDSCDKCLWHKFECVCCDYYAQLNFGKPVFTLRKSRNYVWVKDSLERLKRWKKLLKES